MRQLFVLPSERLMHCQRKPYPCGSSYHSIVKVWFECPQCKSGIIIYSRANCFEQYFTPNKSTGTFNEDGMMLIRGHPLTMDKYPRNKIPKTSASAIIYLVILVQ